MSRRIFTARDIAPLREVAERILERQPDAAVVASAAAPFKRRVPAASVEERLVRPLAAVVESAATPEGIPLHEIAEGLRREVPEVSGVTLTPGGLSLKFERPPTAAERKRIDAFLADGERLQGLRSGLRATPVSTAAPYPREPEALRRILHDPETTDTAWLRAFRAYALDHLVPPPGGGKDSLEPVKPPPGPLAPPAG